MTPSLRLAALAAFAGGTLIAAPAAHAALIKITVENLAPANGTVLTPMWVGVHDGSFDLFDAGAPASAALERLAEDGNPGPLSSLFSSGVQGVVVGPGIGPGSPPLFGPGGSGEIVLDLGVGATDLYLSFASMVVPSNDAFIGNGNPLAYQVRGSGGVIGQSIVILGSQVWDAGTEVNDEASSSTALLGQTVADTGTPENGVVALHGGFIPGGPILTAFTNADFTADGYQVARITITEVPEPTTLALLAGGLGMAGWMRRRRKGGAPM
ncbi:spondin domain-containing protein [Denitromonas iodatirespirans]|uniref:Spondin domain-containing protein n=1 Tax=Denitromonas iodatirespirans TaxID=2795389 RepID=A0A944H6E6_DENI1|nr:spondin domain-containing protein [Denitromonas iodatirespirans]MBT0960099.1 spondin domain-containing protein [Denitromonas iodatirespirans]